MRDPIHDSLDGLRFQTPGYESPPGSNYGCFRMKINGSVLNIISSGSDKTYGWEHVSVSIVDRCPTWDEMCEVCNLFWRKDETVLMFRPKASEYVNKHPFCLHWWKKIDVDHELPPRVCV